MPRSTRARRQPKLLPFFIAEVVELSSTRLRNLRDLTLKAGRLNLSALLAVTKARADPQRDALQVLCGLEVSKAS